MTKRQERMMELLLEMGRIISPTEEHIKRILNSELVDDHNGNIIKADGIIVLDSGEIALYCSNTHFSVNPISKDEAGRYHLEMGSIGGCVRKNPSIAFQIKEYNEGILGKKIVSVHTLTETIKA